MSVICEIKEHNLLQKKLDSMKKAPEKVIKRTMSDIRTRAPGWIAAEVVKTYGVKKKAITGQDIGNVKVKGSKPMNAKIRYTGRVLTPTHFGVSPTAPKENRGGYTLKASIIKGERATLGKIKKLTKKQRKALVKNFTRSGTRISERSPIMLMGTGNKKEGGTNYIPFQRKSTRRTDIKAIKTVSLPQMVSSERTKPGIQQAINTGLQKRLDQHMKLLEK